MVEAGELAYTITAADPSVAPSSRSSADQVRTNLSQVGPQARPAAAALPKVRTLMRNYLC